MLANYYLITITSDVLIFLIIYLYAVFKVHKNVRELVLEVHIFHLAFFSQVEITRFELVTSCLQGRRSPN